MITLTFYDFLLGTVYFTIFTIFFLFIYLTKREERSIYKFLLPGYFFKIIAVIAFLFVYIYYYGGGDTIGYYRSAEVLVNLFFRHPKVYFSILFGNTSLENFSFFDSSTGYPWYYTDTWSFFVVRITSVFVFFGLKSILATTIIVATVTYSGVWYLFKFLSTHYPSLEKQFSIAILFYPSVAFWGSGILKDSYTLMASFFIFVAMFQLLVYKKNIIKNILLFIVSFIIIMNIKPYIFFIEAFSFLVIFLYIVLKGVRIKFLRILLFPVVILSVTAFAIWIYSIIGKTAGGFYASVNDIVEMIVIKQRDLTQEYYGGNSFNIGYFDPTFTGIMSKFFPATIAGLFRPFLWEAKNVVMLLSGIEDFFVLLFFILVVVKFLGLLVSKGIKTVRFLSDTLVVYSLVYSVLFAFVVGLITANFGALVRYRIPYASFFLILLFILNRKLNLAKKFGNS